MRVAIDLTNSPHVPLFAPLVRLLRAGGHDVVLTARRFAQTVELAQLHGLEVEVIGSHGGATRAGKAGAAARRSLALTRYLRGQHREAPIDVAISHGSTDLPVACRMLGVPHVAMFDYEWATTMHRLNCRLSWRVMTPDAIDRARLDAYGAATKLVQYPGLKEEYYLHDATIDPAVREGLGVPVGDLLVVMRPPPELALYHRGHHNELFEQLLARVRAREDVTAVILARTEPQRLALVATHGDDPSVVLPAHAIDGISLIAAADLVVSAGGTMNREAVALGVPVYTVFAGRMGGVDEGLIADGRLRQLSSADDVELTRRERKDATGALPGLRDPQLLLDKAFRGLPTVVQ